MVIPADAANACAATIERMCDATISHCSTMTLVLAEACRRSSGAPALATLSSSSRAECSTLRVMSRISCDASARATPILQSCSCKSFCFTQFVLSKSAAAHSSLRRSPSGDAENGHVEAARSVSSSAQSRSSVRKSDESSISKAFCTGSLRHDV